MQRLINVRFVVLLLIIGFGLAVAPQGAEAQTRVYRSRKPWSRLSIHQATLPILAHLRTSAQSS